MSERVTEVELLDKNKEWFLGYAKPILLERSLRDAKDGLLLSQRQLLWNMLDILKLKSTGSTKKSQSVVGSTLSYAYEHGDSALYDVLRNLSLPFMMRYPLIVGKGSLGTLEDADMFSAARYTECKNSVYAELMAVNAKKNGVDFIPTYTNEDVQPAVLPSAFPNAMVNGASGIGVGFAAKTLPHNLTEVCNAILKYIENGKTISDEELISCIPAPDFPCGGTILNKTDAQRGILTGRTVKTVKIIGDYHVEGRDIIFTSIPYGTYRSSIREQILKKIDIVEKYITDFEDYSNVDGIEIVFTMRAGVSEEDALAAIFSSCDLQTTIGYNMNFVVNGTPKMCSMRDLIEIYFNHQVDVLKRASQFDLEKISKKKHIVEGLVLILSNIDKAISLIKSSPDKKSAAVALEKEFGISNEQSLAVLEMKLSRLTKLDGDELRGELKEMEEKIKDLQDILSSEERQSQEIAKTVADIKSKYGDARRTKLEDRVFEVKKKEKVVTTLNIAVYPNGSVRTYTGVKPTGTTTFTCKSDEYIQIFADEMCHKLKAEKIKSSVEDYSRYFKNKKINKVHLVTKLKETDIVTMVTRNNLIKSSLGSEYLSSASAATGKLSDGDYIVGVVINAKQLSLSDGGQKYEVAVPSCTSRNTKGTKAIKKLAAGKQITIIKGGTK